LAVTAVVAASGVIERSSAISSSRTLQGSLELWRSDTGIPEADSQQLSLAGGMDTGLLLGVIAGILGLLLIVLLVVWRRRRNAEAIDLPMAEDAAEAELTVDFATGPSGVPQTWDGENMQGFAWEGADVVATVFSECLTLDTVVTAEASAFNHAVMTECGHDDGFMMFE
jgi:hypothetical protein